MTPPRPPIRIGTAERSAATKALDEHLTAGRLDAEEYGERFACAAVARTAPQLAALFADLPAPHPLLPGLAVAPQDGRWPPPRPVPAFAPAHRADRGRLGAAVLLATLLPVLLVLLFAATDEGLWLVLLPVLAVVPVLVGRARRR